MTTSIETSIAFSEAFERSTTTTTSTTVNCAAGSTCLWQFEIDLEGAEGDEFVNWSTQYSACTSGIQPPACGPFDVLNDNGVCVEAL